MRIEAIQTLIKKYIFRPLFFNFPVLDRYTCIFRSRKQAFTVVHEFENLLCKLVKNRPREKQGAPNCVQNDRLIDALEKSRASGEINETQYRSNLKITFLAGHENVQQLLNSTFWALGKDTVSIYTYARSMMAFLTLLLQDVQDRLRQEILATQTCEPSPETVNAMPLLTSVVYELLRLYPPLSQLVNRTTEDTTILGGNIVIPPHTWVGWNSWGVQTDTAVWGPQARQFIPERWGTTTDEIQAKFRRENVRGAYIPFNAHARKCLGQNFALLEMKIVLFELLRMLRWTVAPDYSLRLTSVRPRIGVFPKKKCLRCSRHTNHNLLKPCRGVS